MSIEVIGMFNEDYCVCKHENCHIMVNVVSGKFTCLDKCGIFWHQIMDHVGDKQHTSIKRQLGILSVKDIENPFKQTELYKKQQSKLKSKGFK